MRVASSLLLAIVALQGLPATAGPANVSPLAGTWAVDVARLPIPPEARPKSVTIAFSDPGGGNWTTRVEIVDAGGTATHAAGTSSLSGAPAPVDGNVIEADTAAVTQPVPGVLVMNLVRGGVQTSTRVYAVAADGKSMIETASYMTTDGKPVMRTNYFKRVR